MATDLIWAHEVLRPRDMMWSPTDSSIEGGRPWSGDAPQTVDFSGGGLWRADLIGVALRTREQINLWHALEGLLNGRTRTIVVPRCDRRHGPRLQNGGISEPFTDGTYFTDGTGFATDTFSHTLFEDAALRATSVRISRNGARALTGGEHFSINHGGAWGWRLYRVLRILDASGGVSTVEIWPPLRDASDENMSVDFRLPRCTMRLAERNGMALTVEMKRRANPTVKFVEAGKDAA